VAGPVVDGFFADQGSGGPVVGVVVLEGFDAASAVGKAEGHAREELAEAVDADPDVMGATDEL